MSNLKKHLGAAGIMLALGLFVYLGAITDGVAALVVVGLMMIGMLYYVAYLSAEAFLESVDDRKYRAAYEQTRQDYLSNNGFTGNPGTGTRPGKYKE